MRLRVVSARAVMRSKMAGTLEIVCIRISGFNDAWDSRPCQLSGRKLQPRKSRIRDPRSSVLRLETGPAQHLLGFFPARIQKHPPANSAVLTLYHKVLASTER